MATGTVQELAGGKSFEARRTQLVLIRLSNWCRCRLASGIAR